ncbi:MAG: RNA polymerase factor sigma-70 [Planctomycetaceae bacterium]|jgi:RNA polymerase sigma-70 factor (ECF subfamily)|nr:RNA polymerase factor sigma-70 [Planctomycetaceae bacterium]
MNSAGTDQLLRRIAEGDERALDRLLGEQRDYLRRLLEARMEPGLRQRVDPSDVIQEAMLVASRRIDDYLDRRPTTFRLWLRRKTLERLIEARRKHFAQKRTIDRESPLTDASSLAIARHLLSERPSAVVMRQELGGQVREAMLTLSESDREILILRNAEHLTNFEVAQLLEIDPKTASKRYGRAVLRLSEQLSQMGVSN